MTPSVLVTFAAGKGQCRSNCDIANVRESETEYRACVQYFCGPPEEEEKYVAETVRCSSNLLLSRLNFSDSDVQHALGKCLYETDSMKKIGEGRNWVFGFEDGLFKDLVFKGYQKNRRCDYTVGAEMRYEQTLTAHKIVELYNLELAVPQVCYVSMDDSEDEFVIEERLPVNVEQTENVREWAKCTDENNQDFQNAWKSLAFFIKKTGYSDVQSWNNPFIKNSNCSQIALVDVEGLTDFDESVDPRKVDVGLFGRQDTIQGVMGMMRDNNNKWLLPTKEEEEKCQDFLTTLYQTEQPSTLMLAL